MSNKIYGLIEWARIRRRELAPNVSAGSAPVLASPAKPYAKPLVARET
jgi:hypothetical protein